MSRTESFRGPGFVSVCGSWGEDSGALQIHDHSFRDGFPETEIDLLRGEGCIRELWTERIVFILRSVEGCRWMRGLLLLLHLPLLRLLWVLGMMMVGSRVLHLRNSGWIWLDELSLARDQRTVQVREQ